MTSERVQSEMLGVYYMLGMFSLWVGIGVLAITAIDAHFTIPFYRVLTAIVLIVGGMIVTSTIQSVDE